MDFRLSRLGEGRGLLIGGMLGFSLGVLLTVLALSLLGNGPPAAVECPPSPTVETVALPSATLSSRADERATPRPLSPTAAAEANASIASETGLSLTTWPTYCVREGDTLWTIAAAHQISVEALKALNGLEEETIYPGQILKITGTLTVPQRAALAENASTAWHPSILAGDLDHAYPLTYAAGRFTLHYAPSGGVEQDLTHIVAMIQAALEHLETLTRQPLPGSFDVYVADSLFAPPDQSLKGMSHSADRYYIFLYDATGDQADQQYIAAHELAHLFSWNTFGAPVSAMLSEGFAVYTGMDLIADAGYLPIETFCKACQQDGRLPSLAGALSFQGHIRDLDHYYAAGCFVQYLITRYGAEKFAQLYGTGDYTGIYGKSLPQLEEEWLTHLETEIPDVDFDPDRLCEAVETVKAGYQTLFDDFQGTEREMQAYRSLEQARVALLRGQWDEVDRNIRRFYEQTAP